MSELNDELEDLDSDDDYIPAEVYEEVSHPLTEVIRPNHSASGIARISPADSHPYIQRSQTRAPLRSAPRPRSKVFRKLNPKYKLKGYQAIYVVMNDKIVIFK